MLVSSYQNGTTAGFPPPKRSHEWDSPRGDVGGWSADSVRRHTKWLYGVQLEGLDGVGISLTLTVADLPPSPAEWKRLRDVWWQRCKRHAPGLLRAHWVTEWQRRGVPHMHLAVFAEPGSLWAENHELLAWLWLGVAWKYGARSQAQDATLLASAPAATEGAEPSGRTSPGVTGGRPQPALSIAAVGWLKYLSKHASRGVHHYQRQGTPEGWEGRSGRLWGHWGPWPVGEPMRFELDRHAGYRLRRLVQAWRVADARAAGDWKRLAYARRMLKGSYDDGTAHRGVSDWISEPMVLAMLALMDDQGEGIEQR